MRRAFAQRFGHDRRVIGKPFGKVAVEQPAAQRKRLRKVPMVQRYVRLDAVFAQRLHERTVILYTFFIDFPYALRQNARPGNRKTVSLHAQAFQQAHVLFEPLVRAAGGLRVAAFEDAALAAAEHVPHRIGAAVFGGAALDLKSGRRRAPHKGAFSRFGHPVLLPDCLIAIPL